MTPTDRAAQISRMLDANPKLDRLKAKAPPRIPEDIPEPSPARKAKIARWTQIVAPHLKALAIRRGEYGVVADDARPIAEAHGIAPGTEQRAWSWTAAVAPAAGLVASKQPGRYNAQRNKQTVFVAPEWAK